jgi:hypothetical protein
MGMARSAVNYFENEIVLYWSAQRAIPIGRKNDKKQLRRIATLPSK